MTPLPKSIFELLDLENFRKRTPMYIGEWSINRLEAFIHGYFYALEANNIQEESLINFGEFHDWVANHYGWKESTAGWRNIILQECNNDEKKALHTFFELYDKFKKEQLR